MRNRNRTRAPHRPAARLAALGAATTVAATSLAGCAAFSDSGSETGPDDAVRVVAAFYPLEFIVSRVGGTDVTIADLTSPGAEPHDLELSVRETAEVSEADLVVYEKGFQAQVDAAVDQSEAATVDAAAVAGLEETGHAGHDHGSEEGDDGHDHEEGELGDLDPHFWQDPLKMAAVGDAVADELADLDPDHAEDYQQRADELRADLEALDQAYATGLTGCARSTVVVSHDAFGYLTRYGLEFDSIAGLSPDAEPTPADLARLQELISSEGITTVFGERLASPKMAETLADDMGVTMEILDPIEGLADDTSGEDYLSLMEQNLAALQEANQCP